MAACGGGGGGGGAAPGAALNESEPNDDVATAELLAVGQTGHGTVADGSDADVWAVALTLDEVITVEVFGNRFDQAAWSAGTNSPSVTLLGVDGTSELRRQGANSFGWHTEQDTDLLFFRAPAAGTYFLRMEVDITHATGGEYLLAVRDTSLVAPLQFELEPAGVFGLNDADTTAETLAPGTMLAHFVDDEQDWYAFTIAEPSLVLFTMSSHRNGVFEGDDDVFDPALQLLDSSLAVLRANDDVFYLDSAIRTFLSTPGTYFVQVAECCGTGDGGYALEYQLEPLSSLTETPEIEPNDALGTGQSVGFDELVSASIVPGNPDYYTVTCNGGDRLWLEIYDLGTHQGASATMDVLVRDALGTTLPSDTGSELRTLRVLLPATGAYEVRVASNLASDYALRVRRLPGANPESEPNDAAADAGAFDLGGRSAGAIASVGDVDLFAFDAVRGVPVVFACFADNVAPDGYFELNGFGSALDPVLRVRTADGTQLAEVLPSLGTALGSSDGLPTLSLAFLPPASGTYYLEVADEFGNFGTDFTYVLEIR
ncbi:MAG: hypothetical protein HOP15_14010 [Planctomycetes bacterium]|nr:hypothetical protein [Planctomycetota bacterium]